ncbi:MAG: hypothetical protein ABSH07_12705 [Candidatus Dormibacteria bacterium]|jgi:hypothetical protein
MAEDDYVEARHPGVKAIERIPLVTVPDEAPPPPAASAGITIPPGLGLQIARDHLQHLSERADLEAQIEQLRMRLMIAEATIAELRAQLESAVAEEPAVEAAEEKPA